jgi:hypothetical protein
VSQIKKETSDGAWFLRRATSACGEFLAWKVVEADKSSFEPSGAISILEVLRTADQAGRIWSQCFSEVSQRRVVKLAKLIFAIREMNPFSAFC